MFLTTSVGDSIFQLIVVLLIFVIVLALTYYSTKWIAGYQKSTMKNRNLQVVDTLRLPNNKYLQIIKAGKDKCFVIGIGKDEVSLIGELREEELLEIAEVPQAEMPSMDFKSILEKFQKNIPPK